MRWRGEEAPTRSDLFTAVAFFAYVTTNPEAHPSSARRWAIEQGGKLAEESPAFTDERRAHKRNR